MRGSRKEHLSARPSSILMLGPSPEAFGGMASVIKAYQAAGLFERWPVLQIDTTAETRQANKLAMLAVAVTKVLAMCLRGKVQGLHLHVATRVSFYRKSIFMVIALMARVPYVIHLHGADFDVFYSKECGALARRYLVALFGRSAAVIVLGERWRTFISSITPNPRVVCIFNPVILSSNVGASQEGRGGQNILFLGQLGRRKGVADLISAVALLRERVPSVHLMLCGDGDNGVFARQASELGISGQVSFYGWVVGDQKARLMAEATLLALPSYHEGLPMAILEAMGSGLPVVASDVGSIPEAVTDGIEGLLIKPGNVSDLAAALERLLTNPMLRERIATAAQQKARALFESSIIVEQVSNLYAEVGFAAVAPRMGSDAYPT